MNSGCRCDRRETPRAGSRRIGRFLRWFVPGFLLAVMPKCPVCFAAYIAMASGIGLTLPAAAFLRTALIALCVLSLACLAVACIRRWIGRAVVRH